MDAGYHTESSSWVGNHSTKVGVRQKELGRGREQISIEMRETCRHSLDDMIPLAGGSFGGRQKDK